MAEKDQFELSHHAQTMLVERGIQEDWLWLTLLEPDRIEEETSSLHHYIKAITQHNYRYLRIIINIDETRSNIVL